MNRKPLLPQHLIFNKVFEKAEKIPTKEMAGEFFFAMCGYFLRGEEPDFNEGKMEGLFLSMLFADVKEGEEVGIKNYGETCEGKYWADIYAEAVKIGYVEKGKRLDSKKFADGPMSRFSAK